MSYRIGGLVPALVAFVVVAGTIPGGAVAAGGGLDGGVDDPAVGPVESPANGTAYVVSMAGGAPVAVASQNVSVNETIGGGSAPVGATVGATVNGTTGGEAPLVVHLYESDIGTTPACDTNADARDVCKVYTNNVPPHFWDATPLDRPEENPVPVQVPGVPVELLLQHPENLPNVLIIVVAGEVQSRWPDQAPVEPNDLPVRLFVPSDPTIPDDHPIREDEIGVPGDGSDDDDGNSDGGADDGGTGDGSGEAGDGTNQADSDDGRDGGTTGGGSGDAGGTGAGASGSGGSNDASSGGSSGADDRTGSQGSDGDGTTATEAGTTGDGTTTDTANGNGEADGTTTPTDGLNTPASGPGFGVLASVIGLLAAALVARRVTG